MGVRRVWMVWVVAVRVMAVENPPKRAPLVVAAVIQLWIVRPRTIVQRVGSGVQQLQRQLVRVVARATFTYRFDPHWVDMIDLIDDNLVHDRHRGVLHADFRRRRDGNFGSMEMIAVATTVPKNP